MKPSTRLITGISHLGFVVSDMEAMLDFSCTGLGLEHTFTMTYADLRERMEADIRANRGSSPPQHVIAMVRRKGDDPWFTYLRIAPGQFLELFYPDDSTSAVPGARPTPGYDHLSLAVKDVVGVIAELRSRGSEPISELRFGPDGTWQVWYDDPDGNRLELMQYTEDSVQLH